MSEDLRGYKSRAPIIEVRAADLGPVSDVRRAEIARLERVIDGDRQYIKRRVVERDTALAALDRVLADMEGLRAISDMALDGPWRARLFDGEWQVVDPDNDVVAVCPDECDMNNDLIAAAVNYLRAALDGPDE